MNKFKKSLVAVLFFVCASSIWIVVQADSGADIDGFLSARTEKYTALYQHLHRNPELSTKEEKTSALVAAEFRALGLETTERVGGYGVVGVLRNGAGPVALVRGDMDALPVQEETGLPYASQNPGVMHACGHDLHVANLISIAEAMVQFKAHWNGTIVFVAQPAEETVSGARAMINDGLFTRFPKPDYAIALHVTQGIPYDSVAIRAGEAMASADFYDVTFNGKDGHASRPHEAVDPISLGAEFVLKIKGLVQNEIDPLKPAVLNVGSFHSGTKHNIIPRTSLIQVNMRTFDDGVRAHLMKRLNEVAVDLSRINRADAPTVTSVSSTPPLFNNLELSAAMARVFKNIPGLKYVDKFPAIMGAEDFALYPREANIPGVLFVTGAYSPEKPKPWPLSHSSTYAPDFVPSWKSGAKAMFAVLLDLQKKKSFQGISTFMPVHSFTNKDLSEMRSSF